MAAETQGSPYTVWPIGTVDKSEDAVRLRVFEQYADALKGLGDFSHVCVLWWFHQNDTPENRAILQVRPRRNPNNPLTGVFACRSPYRPNLIALDVCRILAIEGTTVHIDKIMAFDGTPILDLKPYIPNLDAPAEDIRLPAWLSD